METLLSLQMVLACPAIAATSAAHLAALRLPATIQRLYIALDQDQAGRRAAERLSSRARAAGVEVLTLHPALGDLNNDLRQQGLMAMARHLRPQLASADVMRLCA